MSASAETGSRLPKSGSSLPQGPWTASIERKPFDGSGHWYVIVDEEENGLGEFYGDDHEANVANARLAAAAPELYEALRKIEAAPAWGYPERWETTPAEVRQIARTALAKARGEA